MSKPTKANREGTPNIFMKNKRHLGFSTTVRATPHLDPEAGHHHPSLTGIKGDGIQAHMTGILSYPNGLAAFDARLTESEEKELRRLLTGVADRVYHMLLDNEERRQSHPSRSVIGG